MDRDATLYDRDFYAWTQEQAAVLRGAGVSGTNLPVDWENVAEEVESMGLSDLNAALSYLSRVVEHLLKLEHSPARDPRRGWEESIVNARGEIELLLRKSPSLRRKIEEEMAWSYGRGRKVAAKGLAVDPGFTPADLPADCPYTLDELLDDDFWPANRHGLA